MAITTAHPARHSLPKIKEDKFPQPTPPNVSVEAIRRSLLHTPNPRRFKKLRLRRLQERLQENLRREGAILQLPLADAQLREFGEGRKGKGKEDHTNGAKGLEADGNDGLDELNLASLTIGLEDSCSPRERPVTLDQRPSCNLKSLLETPDRDTLKSYERLCEASNTDNEGNEELGKKRRQRNGKTRKKQPRRLSVDKLVLACERTAELNLPSHNEVRELSQDPISQLSVDVGSSKPRKTAARHPVKVNRRKMFGIIDISRFRLPRPRKKATHTQNNSPRSPTYADGFEGLEAFPIGRPMPIPQRGRLPPKSNKLRVSLAELTLVAEKEVKLEYQDTPPSHSETDGHLHLKKQPTLAPYNDLCEESFISLPPFVHDHCGRNIFEKDEEGPEWTSDSSLILDIATPGTISSPLARKESDVRKMKFGEHATGEEEEGESQSLTLGLPQRKPKALPEHDTGSKKGHKARDPSLFFSNSPLRHRKDELDGFQELAAVSTRSRVYFSDSNESNDYESSMGDKAHSEIHRTDEEHEQGRDAPPDKVSGKESDVEMEDSINSCLL